MISSFLRHFATKKYFLNNYKEPNFCVANMPTTEANTTMFCGPEIPACGHIFPLYHTPFFPACQPFGALELRPYLISFATKLRFVDDFQLSTLFYYKKLFFLCKYRESNFFVANLPISVANTTMFLPAEMPQFPAFLTSSFFSFQLIWISSLSSSSLSGFQLAAKSSLPKSSSSGFWGVSNV